MAEHTVGMALVGGGHWNIIRKAVFLSLPPPFSLCCLHLASFPPLCPPALPSLLWTETMSQNKPLLQVMGVGYFYPRVGQVTNTELHRCVLAGCDLNARAVQH